MYIVKAGTAKRKKGEFPVSAPSEARLSVRLHFTASQKRHHWEELGLSGFPAQGLSGFSLPRAEMPSDQAGAALVLKRLLKTPVGLSRQEEAHTKGH